MKRAKKVLYFIAVLLLVSLLFAGCAPEQAPPAPPPDEEPADTPAPEPEPAPADTYPSKPVTLIVPMGAGGSHDLHARVIASTIPQYLGVPMVVELKPGGSGAIGSEYVAKSKPDGYTLLFGGSGPNTTLHHAQDLPYTREDFAPIAKINHSPAYLVVRKDSPFQTLQDLVDYAKDHPGELTYGSTGPFGAGHVPAEMFLDVAGLDVVHVPFDGGGPCLMALLGGQVDFIFNMPTQVRELYDAGDVRCLVQTDTVRDPGNLEDVATARELGYDVVYAMGRFVLAPRDTPEDVVIFLRETFAQLVEDPTFQSLIKQLGEEIQYLDGPDFQIEWDADFAAQEATIKRLAAQQ